jgi:membrane protein
VLLGAAVCDYNDRMSTQTRRLEKISERIRRIYQEEQTETRPLRRRWLWLMRWSYLLYHQFIADDVRIRSESLTFLMIFSLLPLTAGAFIVFTLFTQFGMVQEAIEDGLDGFLDTIPDDHRDFVLGYIMKGKDAYIDSLGHKSSSFGIFVLFILIWVGLKFFNNIERTLNHIWSADRERAFVEQLRNFLVITIAAPIVLIGGLSLPLILHNLAATQYLDNLRLLSALLAHIVPTVLIFLTFFSLYKYVPVRRVRWRSALCGALFATVFLQLTNLGMRLYFRVGTNSAYGKIAVIPLVGFWIYVVWIVVILGAELSYLMQNQGEVLASTPHEPTFREGEALLIVLKEMDEAFHSARNPVGFETLQQLSGLKASRLRLLLRHLKDRQLILECTKDGYHLEGFYVLARDLAEVPVSALLSDFFAASWRRSGQTLGDAWQSSLQRWAETFQTLRIKNLNPIPAE